MKSSFHKRKHLLGRTENYMFWKEFKDKHPKYKDIENKDLTKATHGFFKYAGTLMVQSQHGLILNGIGYFANAVFEKKKLVRIADKLIVNLKHDSIYNAYFFPRIFKANPFNSWNFKIYRPLKAQMKDLIKNGIDYKCHYDILKKNASGVKYFINDK